MSRGSLGQWGEDRAAAYLQDKGWTIQERNLSTPVGECDLLARDDDQLVFVEVKTRSGSRFGSPEEAVSRQKRHQLRRVARYVLATLEDPVSCRFDVVAIRLRGTESSLHHIVGAFDGRE